MSPKEVKECELNAWQRIILDVKNQRHKKRDEGEGNGCVPAVWNCGQAYV